MGFSGDILILGGVAGTIALIFASAGAFSITPSMAITLRRWWPGWLWAYALGITVICCALVAGILVNPHSRSIGLAPRCIFLVVLLIWVVIYLCRTKQPRLSIDLYYDNLSYELRCEESRKITSLLLRDWHYEHLRERELGDSHLALLLKGYCRNQGVILECPRPEESSIIRVHCLWLDLASGKKVEENARINRHHCLEIMTALMEKGFPVDLSKVQELIEQDRVAPNWKRSRRKTHSQKRTRHKFKSSP